MIFKLQLRGEDGRLVDEVSHRTGFRAVALQRWQFSLNGQPEFMRGLNWVPADSLPGRLRRADYVRLLNQVRESGANLLRVWGGGLREKRAFYELCDELGLMVWQEFPFACMFLGGFPQTVEYLALVAAECGAMVRQTSHHPSLIVWCGGNEFNHRRNRVLLDTLARIVQSDGGLRPFIPVSPSRGDNHRNQDAHNWNVWHGQAPIQVYLAEHASFLSEFGLQALPHIDTLTTMLPDPRLGWETHHGDPVRLTRYASIFTPKSSDLGSFISHSQRAQALALQTAIEHIRRRKGESGGGCVWQFNEPWPAVSWAIIDYFGRPKLAYQRLKNWYQPIFISLCFPLGRKWQVGEMFTAEIWSINDMLQPIIEGELNIYVDGKLIYRQAADLPANQAQQLGQLTYKLLQEPQQLTLTFTYDQRVVKNSYDLSWQDQARPKLVQKLRRWGADWVLR